MTMHIAQRIQSMEPSATLEMAKKSRELKSQGLDIISLSLGEPDFDTPEYIKNAGINAIVNNITKYPPVAGFMELREAISTKFKRDNNLDYKPSQVVVSTGAKQSLANIFLSVLDEGDEVIIFAPYWVTYYEQIKLAQGVPVVLQSDISSDYKINPEELKKAINEKTKLIIFSSPCNPSGTVFSKENLSEIANIVKDHPEVVIISDEIYELINFEGKHESIAQFDSVKEQTVIVNGVSKGFAMTGWRLGYIAAPQWLADACIKAQGQITSGTSTVSQMAAIEALSQSPSKVDYMVKEFKERKEIVVAGLNAIDGVICNNPTGAFYVFPDVSAFFGKSYEGKAINNASELALFVLEQGKVSIVTGDAFGTPTTIRISYAASKESLIEAIKRIKEALILLK
ncbi:MAG: pyridoxal phosphate-dependent aminotransferase [Flavobacteriales bacterium]|nr:pyridoxal phosphate-dependent aminotransferase [Flavobacteriales bacterium]